MVGRAVRPEVLSLGEVPGLGDVQLRPWRDDDHDAVLRAYLDPDIIRWITQVPKPDDSYVRTWLRQRQDGWARGSLISWAVTAGRDGSAGGPSAANAEALLGSVALKRFDYARQKPPPVHADVSYWIVPDFRGHGLATRVASFAARWAWSSHRLHRVELHHELSNSGSCWVAEKAGYELEGTLRRSYWTPGGWVDEHIHAFIAPGE
jgi:RimJ/RimL family protein N-acetyltransferase